MTTFSDLLTDPAARRVLVFTAAYSLIATVLVLILGNYEFVAYVGIVWVLLAVVAWTHTKNDYPEWLLWCLSVWGMLHLYGGLVPVPQSWPIHGDTRVLYSLWFIPDLLKYDHIVHAYGFGITTWVCWYGLCAVAGRTLAPTFGALTLAATASLGFGGLNEVIEFFLTLTLPETNVGGYINTGWDLVSNTVGAIIAAITIRLTCDRPDASEESH